MKAPFQPQKNPVLPLMYIFKHWRKIFSARQPRQEYQISIGKIIWAPEMLIEIQIPLVLNSHTIFNSFRSKTYGHIYWKVQSIIGQVKKYSPMLILSAIVFLYLESVIKVQLFMKIYVKNLFLLYFLPRKCIFQNKYFCKTISGKMAFPLNYVRPAPQQSSGTLQPKDYS